LRLQGLPESVVRELVHHRGTGRGVGSKGVAVAATPPPGGSREATVATSHRNLLHFVAWAVGLLLVAACQQSGDPAPSPAVETAAPTEPADFSAAGLETAEVRSFLTTLQQAVRNDDRQTVASLVSYPITIRIDGAPTTLADPAAFIANYQAVMTKPVRAAVEAAEPDTLFANSDGVMMGRGQVWFGGVYEDGAETYDIRIVGINPG
jgi:hypothetical protein